MIVIHVFFQCVLQTCDWLFLSCDCSQSGSTPLHIAAQLGNERIIDLLIRSNASCDARNYAGKQPKDVAAPFLSRRCRGQ